MTRAITIVAGWTALLVAAPAAAATIAGAVTINGRPAVDAVVYLEAAEPAPPAVTSHAVMDQKRLEFVPKVLPVVRGTTVEFTNSDDIQHNVFSPSDAARKFDLGTYGPGATRSVTLSEPGEVLVLCNIHMEMEARILVLRDPYFALVGADGTYRIADVPPGTYRAKLWRDHFLSDVRALEIPALPDVTLDLAFGR